MESGYAQIGKRIGGLSGSIPGSLEQCNAAQNACEVMPTPPIQKGFVDIGESREHIYTLVQELERKISAVLRPAPPQGQSQNKEAAAPVRSGLTEALTIHGAHLREIASQIAQLIDRVEL